MILNKMAFVKARFGDIDTAELRARPEAEARNAGLALDRYWRNLRTQSLHDPVDYKVRELGEWALTGSAPVPTFYS